MRVTRLEIFGFKSFVDRFVLNFDHNMIGIVGPNGCGKSNVVDSLRWVLGETHAKHLRGGSFEDLIFNGSDSRRQLGMAEVSLTIRPQEGWKEKVEENHGAPSEIEDIIPEEFQDDPNELAVELPDELSGELSKELSQEPKTDSDSLTPLQLLPDRVMQIPGLFEAAELQFTRRLYRSGESEYFINRIPCRLRDMHELYRLIGLGARGLSIVQQGQIGQFISKKPLERRELLEEAAGISGFRTKMEAASRRLVRTNENLSRVSDILIEVEKQVKVLKRQAKRAEERQALKDELKAAEFDLFKCKALKLRSSIDSAQNQFSKLDEEAQGISAEIQIFEANLLETEAAVYESEVEIVALRRTKDEYSKTLLAKEEQLQTVRLKLASCESKIEHLNEEIVRGEARFLQYDQDKQLLKTSEAEIKERVSQQRDTVNSLREETKSLEEKHAQVLKEFVSKQQSNTGNGEIFERFTEIRSQVERSSLRIEEIESELSTSSEVSSRLNILSRELSEKSKLTTSLQNKLVQVQSQINAIEEQLNSLAAHVAEATGNDEMSEVLSSAITVSEEDQKAFSALLGERGQFLLSNQSNLLLGNYLNAGTSSKKVGVIDISSREYVHNPVNFAHISGVRPLIDVVQVREDIREVVASIFRYYWIADSKESALELSASLCSEESVMDYYIALKSGEVLTAWGWFSTEGEGVQLSFSRKRAEYQKAEDTLKIEIEHALSAYSESEKELASVKEEADRMNQLRSELAGIQKDLSKGLQEQASLEKHLAAEQRNAENELRESLRGAERLAQRAHREAEDSLRELETQTKILENRQRQLEIDQESLKQHLSSQKEQITSVENERSRLESAALDAAQDSSSTEVEEVRQQIAEIEQQITTREDARVTIQKDVGDIRYQLSQAKQSKDAVDAQSRNFNSTIERASIELDLITQDFARYYSDEDPIALMEQGYVFMTPGVENIDEQTPQENVATDHLIKNFSETAKTLRKRLDREGEVDSSAIERYKEESLRFENMSKQHNDLTSAKEVLERTIKELRELSKIRFVKTFAEVNEKFKELIPRLFAGGSGYLELVNPDDPLNSGVEIVVRPPGKKITTMELMSGGEKALVATAVLVAMFLHHPGPICVLDEVDAPLDDANLGRFLELIKEISDTTQFLVITHNKVTMQAVDRLIGITMQESGVTTAISVDLEQAEASLEKVAVNG